MEICEGNVCVCVCGGGALYGELVWLRCHIFFGHWEGLLFVGEKMVWLVKAMDKINHTNRDVV